MSLTCTSRRACCCRAYLADTEGLHPKLPVATKAAIRIALPFCTIPACQRFQAKDIARKNLDQIGFRQLPCLRPIRCKTQNALHIDCFVLVVMRGAILTLAYTT
jgi:hypothetical protein